jgi:hypothetical protein
MSDDMYDEERREEDLLYSLHFSSSSLAVTTVLAQPFPQTTGLAD